MALLLARMTVPTPVLTATRSGTDSLLQWTATHSRVQGWRVQRQDNGGAWATLATNDSDDLDYTDSAATADGTYVYRIVAFRGAQEATSDESEPIVVGGGGGGGGGDELLAFSDITYLGSFRMPASVTYSGVVVQTSFGKGGIAYRGKGGVDRILMTSHNTTPSNKQDRVYEVTVPTLGTTEPYPLASIYKAWDSPYGSNRITSSPNQKWTNGLFVDPDNWDDLYYNWASSYGPGSTDPSVGKALLDDAASTATAVSSWYVDIAHVTRTMGGMLRMPAAFVAANCPGKPFMVGFGGAWMSTVAAASRGPAFYAIPNPNVATYAAQSALPGTLVMRHESAGDPTDGELPALRDADYEGATWGTCATGTAANRLFLASTAYSGTSGQTRYNGKTATIYAGTGIGQERTITYVTGREYSVTPDWDPVPDTTTSKYAINYSGTATIFPDGDTGYWTAADNNRQSTVWVDGTKQGVLVAVLYVINRQFYGPGGNHYENCQIKLRCYDPDDLASIMAGTTSPWAVQPIWEEDFEFPNKTYPLSADLQDQAYVNLTWDQSNRRLYAVDMRGWLSTGNYRPVVHVYSVGGSN
jgi:hypothetical protein